MKRRRRSITIKLYDPRLRELEKAEERKRDLQRIQAGELAAVVAKNNPLAVTRESLRELTTGCPEPNIYTI